VSWITGTAGGWDALLDTQPELSRLYGEFYRSLWDGPVDHRVLTIARLRIAAIQDCEADWATAVDGIELSDAQTAALRAGDPTPFDEPVRAALALTERMPFDHHGISDADVEAAAEHFGPDGAVSLLTALAFFDSNCRLQKVSGVDASLHDHLIKQSTPQS